MSLPILDLFLLSMLDRGLQSPYELHREAGISLGASLPSLRRLTEATLVARKDTAGATKRPRHEYHLTASGKNAARTGWQERMASNAADSDLDSVLRIADMGLHYGADKKKIQAFLRQAAAARIREAERAALSEPSARSGQSYASMRSRCDSLRLRAEAEALLGIADSFKTRRIVSGQQSLM